VLAVSVSMMILMVWVEAVLLLIAVSDLILIAKPRSSVALTAKEGTLRRLHHYHFYHALIVLLLQHSFPLFYFHETTNTQLRRQPS
jgi:hypothetical protein